MNPEPAADRPPGQVPLLLDEMFSPRIAEELRRRGHDVVALVVDPELRALSDHAVYAWATEHARRVVTENVKDFRGLVASSSGPGSGPGVLFTSSRNFPRSRHDLFPLINALDHWLNAAESGTRRPEDWLSSVPPN